MRMIFKVSYYVRSNYENKQGKSPLMIRIFLNGEMLNVGSSGIYIDKKLWNNSTNRVKGRGSESLNLNAQLDNISNSLQMIFKKHEFDEDLTLDKIKSIFLGKNKVKTTFVEFYDKYLEDIKAQVGAGKSIALYHKYSAARSHFVNFLHAKYGRKDLMPGELTHLIIHDFEIYLKTIRYSHPSGSIRSLTYTYPEDIVLADNFHAEVTLKDLNFDGQDDIAIPLGNYGNQRIQYEDGYLWDKTQKTYVPVKQLKEIANLRIDKEERCLFSFSRESAASYHYERYEYVDAELVKTAELIQTYRQAGGKLLFTEKHYQKGKGMRVVHSSVPIHEISHYWLKIVQK